MADALCPCPCCTRLRAELKLDTREGVFEANKHLFVSLGYRQVADTVEQTAPEFARTPSELTSARRFARELAAGLRRLADEAEAKRNAILVALGETADG